MQHAFHKTGPGPLGVDVESSCGRVNGDECLGYSLPVIPHKCTECKLPLKTSLPEMIVVFQIQNQYR